MGVPCLWRQWRGVGRISREASSLPQSTIETALARFVRDCRRFVRAAQFCLRPPLAAPGCGAPAVPSGFDATRVRTDPLRTTAHSQRQSKKYTTAVKRRPDGAPP